MVHGEPGECERALLEYLAGRGAVTDQGTGQGVDGRDGTAPGATVIVIRHGDADQAIA